MKPLVFDVDKFTWTAVYGERHKQSRRRAACAINPAGSDKKQKIGR